GTNPRVGLRSICCALACELGLHELKVQCNGDLFAYENAAGLERCVPSQPKVFPIDFRSGRDRDPAIAPGIFRRGRWALDCKYNLPGDATNAQVAFDGQLSVPDNANGRRLEGEGGKLFHMKEVGTLQMCIALVVVSVN